MAKPLLLLLTLTALGVVAASAASSVTIYNPATLPLNVVLLSAGDHPRDGADYEDAAAKVSTPVSTTMMTTVNLTEPEQDIQITTTTDEGHEVEVHVQDGDVLVVIPSGLGFNIEILHHDDFEANLGVVPPGPK